MIKGQIEIIVILGIIIVALVVILFTIIPHENDIPLSIRQKYESFKTSFESLIKDAAIQSIKKLFKHGGYLNSSYPLGYVIFMGEEVPYWQYNGQVIIPDVRSNFIIGVEEYLKANKDKIIDYANVRGVELGDIQVNTVFQSNRIIITVNMPTKIDGYDVQKPYIVEIKTNFDEIVGKDQFVESFVTYSLNKRPFEYFTISSMILSPLEEDVNTIPIFIFLTECGESVFKNWWDIKTAMERTIRTTLANIYMPGKEPTDFLKNSVNPKYSLFPLKGRRFENLDVSFELPDNFELTQENFRFRPDPIAVTSNIIPIVGVCQSDPVYVSYFVSYPVVVRVKDPQTQNVFQFALHVYIKDNDAGSWATISDYESDLQALICSNLQCSADISLKDSNGIPIDYAYVSFMGCSLGRTDSQGRFRGPAPCGLGPLEINRYGFGTYKKMHSSDDLIGLSLTLIKAHNIRLNFYEVVIHNLSLSGGYSISKDDIKPIGNKQTVYIEFYDLINGENYQYIFTSSGGEIKSIPAGNYLIGAALISDGKEMGSFFTDYILSENLEGNNLYVYVPSMMTTELIENDVEKTSLTVIMTNILSKCGVGPISKKEVNDFSYCFKSYGDII